MVFVKISEIPFVADLISEVYHVEIMWWANEIE